MNAFLREKCEVVVDPAETKIVVQKVRDQFAALGQKDLLGALGEDVPVTVLKLERNSTVAAIVLVGFRQEEVSDVSIVGNKTHKNTVVRFTTSEDKASGAHTSLSIAGDPVNFHFTYDGWGLVDASLDTVVDGDDELPDTVGMKAVLSPATGKCGLDSFFTPGQCIVVKLSNALMVRLNDQGIEAPAPFAIVEAVQPVLSPSPAPFAPSAVLIGNPV